jgi:hypothetical protein
MREGRPYYMSGEASWLPTEDVWRFREFDRGGDDPRFGGGQFFQDGVARLEAQLRYEGQREPVTLLWNPRLHAMHLGEGNHRVAAARNIGQKYIYTMVNKSERVPNESWMPEIPLEKPPGAERSNVWLGTKGAGGYIPTYPDVNDFDHFKGKSIRPGRLAGSPSDRAIVKALGNRSAAKNLLTAMTKAGKVFGPAAGAIGLVAGLNDPAEALGATVGRAGDTKWARKQVTPKMRREERRYYADKRARQRAANPLTALLDNVEKKKRLSGRKSGSK